MDTQSTDQKEEALVAMLASIRKEACYRDNFEEEFLHNFHMRKEADQATQSTWKLLTERLDNYLQNFRGWQWVYASMAIVTLAAVGVIITSSDMEPAESYATSKDNKKDVLEKAIPVSNETTTTTFESGPDVRDNTNNNSQPQMDSHPDDKPVSRVLIEM